MNLNHLKTQQTSYDLQADAERMADAIMDELDLEDITAELEGADACVITTGNRYDDISEENFNRKKVARLRQLIASGEYTVDADAIAEALLSSGRL